MELAFWILIALVGLAAIVWLALMIRRTKPTEEQAPVDIPDDCCGAHAVCERDSLLTKTDKVIYFDDEELDTLSHKPIEEYTAEDIHQLEEVFYTLREQDVAGWIRSLQLRDIALPDDLRDEALLIVSERRQPSYHKNRII